MKMDEMKKRFEDEWVLAKVLELDELDQPKEVEVIAHSKNRDEIYDKQKKMKGFLAIFYTGEALEEGYAVAFYGSIFYR
ncbi:MAG TPA: hypothetical protein VJH24_04735 [Candidatus Bilamarchaeaceae archaeon]|nr:hypothetical protein [Candidatus Bilamarchaeaceae archaeon]